MRGLFSPTIFHLISAIAIFSNPIITCPNAERNERVLQVTTLSLTLHIHER